MGFILKHRWLILILVLGFIIRIIPAFIFYGTGDVSSDSAIAVKFLQGKDLYRQTNYNHYPVLIYLWALAEILQQWTHIGKHFWQKLPSVISDIFITIIIYRSIIGFKNSKNKALKGATLYALNPVVLLTSSFHGQYDSLLMLVVLYILYLYQFSLKKAISLSFVLISLLGITLKGWVILTPALIAFHLKKININIAITYLFSLLTLLFIFTLPLLFIYSDAFVKNVFGYYPAPDHGLGAIFEHFPSIFKNVPLSIVRLLFFYNHQIFAKLLTVSLLIYGFFAGRKANIFNAMLLLYLIIYCTSTGLASQYLMWVVPLSIIVYDRMIIPYSLFASFEIITFYLDRYKSAFTPTVYNQFFNIGFLPVSYGKMIIIFWLFCILWLLLKFREVNVND